MPAQDQRDEEMAHKYGISVEVLREGIPRRLQRFPDGQIVFGDRLCVRIATAKQLEETLDLVDSSAVIGRPPHDLDIYIVPYLPPSETVELRQLWLQRVEGAPNVALHSMNILEAKEEVLDLITQKITAVNELIGQLQNLADRLMLHKNPAGNAHLFSLKIRYVLCKIRSGKNIHPSEYLCGMPVILDQLGICCGLITVAYACNLSGPVDFSFVTRIWHLQLQNLI
jgi:hypothetical protein